MPALVATRFNPDLKAKYNDLPTQERQRSVALTAIMRKLILLANALLKANRTWTPNPLDQIEYSRRTGTIATELPILGDVARVVGVGRSASDAALAPKRRVFVPDRAAAKTGHDSLR
jgi:hypothetical protein